MSRKIAYTDEPLGTLRIISDVLPSPEELAVREETVKITISLSKKSVDFFKLEAGKTPNPDRPWPIEAQRSPADVGLVGVFFYP